MAARQRALVVGPGTGYSAAILSAIGLHVTALESSPELAAAARSNKVRIVDGPLEEGYPKAAPYDQILIDGAVEYLPDAIIDQLATAALDTRKQSTLAAAIAQRTLMAIAANAKRRS